MAFLDEFNALVAAGKPKCRRCGDVAATKITFTERVGRRDIWDERYACREHGQAILDHLKAIGVIRHIKWL